MTENQGNKESRESRESRRPMRDHVSSAHAYLNAMRGRLQSAVLYGVLPATSHHATLRWVRRSFKFHSRVTQRVELTQRALYHRLGVAHEVDLMAIEGALTELEISLREMSDIDEMCKLNEESQAERGESS